MAIAISSQFLEAFARLPKKIQGKTTEFINKFRADPTSNGINFEKINGAIDQKIYSVRIDQTYRGIVVRQPETNTYLLLWVDHHDEAYQWAASKRCDVNPINGSIQIYDMRTILRVRKREEAEKRLFDQLSDEELQQLCVPKPMISIVRSFGNKEEFIEERSRLPSDAAEYLNYIAEGIPLSEVLEMIDAERLSEEAGDDLSKALHRGETKKSFYVVEGEEELRQVMSAPLEKWRVFLHPAQRKLISKNYNGAARVLGGAGTGKTVVAMHRAKYLASRAKPYEKILFTTFTANLADDIRQNLKKICTPEEMSHIDVINLDAWAAHALKEMGYQAKVEYGKQVDEAWEQAMNCCDTGYTMNFFKEEWDRVIVDQRAFLLAKYAVASRLGRGTRLNRMERKKIWPVFHEYITLMHDWNFRDVSTAMNECAVLIPQKLPSPVYQYVIVDEGQDFSPAAYRLIRAIAGEPHPNDIFIVGDAHQRIYKNHAKLSRCGINIRGRGSILKLNYRTTEEIRRYAFALLKDIAFDDLDDSTDVGDACRSLTHGVAPVVKNFHTSSLEKDFLIQEIKTLAEQQVELSNVCIVARTKKLLMSYMKALDEAGIPWVELQKNQTDSSQVDGVRLATMHRVKGLEFDYVFVVAVNQNVIPLSLAVDYTDSVTEAESMTAEKCLLYVALTRARRGAYITSYGHPSSFVKKN